MPERERTHGILLLLLAVCLSGAAVAYAQAHWHREVPLDRDHCPATPTGSWLVAIDRTDLLAIQQQERVSRGLLAVAESMAKDERLMVHVITGNAEQSAAPWPLPGFPNGFRLCKSADPKSIDRFVDNERLVRAAYEREFLAPLRAVIPTLVTGGIAQRSPILQAIEVMMWSPLFDATIPNRTLVVYSDLIHHTRELSQLTQHLTDPCRVIASDIGGRLKARNWRGVRVILEYLRNPRDALHQSPEHLKFWSRLFYLVGAAEVFDGPTLIANDAGPCPAHIARTDSLSSKHRHR